MNLLNKNLLLFLILFLVVFYEVNAQKLVGLYYTCESHVPINIVLTNESCLSTLKIYPTYGKYYAFFGYETLINLVAFERYVELPLNVRLDSLENALLYMSEFNRDLKETYLESHQMFPINIRSERVPFGGMEDISSLTRIRSNCFSFGMIGPYIYDTVAVLTNTKEWRNSLLTIDEQRTIEPLYLYCNFDTYSLLVAYFYLPKFYRLIFANFLFKNKLLDSHISKRILLKDLSVLYGVKYEYNPRYILKKCREQAGVRRRIVKAKKYPKRYLRKISLENEQYFINKAKQERISKE